MSNDSSKVSNDFELKRAYHAMQAAEQAMQESQEKMQQAKRKADEIYHEIGDLQAQHDKLKASKDDEWESYSDRLVKMKLKVGEKIEAVNTCNEQEERFKALSKDSQSDELKAVFDEAARFFSKLAYQKMVERDDLIAKKRQIACPDMAPLKELRNKLKGLRAEQEEIVEHYHETKNDFNLRKNSFERAKAKYESVKNPETEQDIDSFSSRPKAMELDEDLLKLAGIPKESWSNCTMQRRADGRVDIYYGGDESTHHGHVILAGNLIEFSREPKKIPN